MKRFFNLFLIIYCFGALLMHAEAKRVALVIGNDSYAYTSKLQKARNDADTISSNLKTFGFTVSLHKDLNYREMVKAIDVFTNNISGGDEVVVFYAGHGIQIKSGSYLLPTDIDAETENQIEKTAYGLNELTEKLSEAKASFSLIVIDACRDNPLKSKGRSVGNSRGLNAIEPAKGQMIVYSASRGQSALDRLNESDKNPNSVFTREFVKQIQQPGISIEKIVRNTQIVVEEIAKSIGHEQRPALYSEARGDFIFTGAVIPTLTTIPQQLVAATVPTSNFESKDGFDLYYNLMNGNISSNEKEVNFKIADLSKNLYPPIFYFDSLIKADEHLFIIPKTIAKIGTDRINISVGKKKIQNVLFFSSVDEGIMSVAVDCQRKLAGVHMETKVDNNKQSQPIISGNPEYMGLGEILSGSIFEHVSTFVCQPHGMLPIIKANELDEKSWTFAFYNTLGNLVFFNKSLIQRHKQNATVPIKVILKNELKNNFSEIKTQFSIHRYRISCKENVFSVDTEDYSSSRILIAKANAYGDSSTQKINPGTIASLAFDLGCGTNK
jgi:hypothetical protein